MNACWGHGKTIITRTFYIPIYASKNGWTLELTVKETQAEGSHGSLLGSGLGQVTEGQWPGWRGWEDRRRRRMISVVVQSLLLQTENMFPV